VASAGAPRRAALYCGAVSTPATSTEVGKRDEIRAFGLLAFVLAPVLAVLFVAGFGFIVWIWQMFAGPPGPPAP
jgi:nitrate reductase NapE